MNDPHDLNFAIASASLAGAAQSKKFAFVPIDRATSLQQSFPNVTFLTFKEHSDIPKIIASLVREVSVS
jgi:hypothetical protein